MWGVGLGSAWVLERGLRAMEAYPVNVGLLGRGSSSRDEAIREAIGAHVCGLKVHEDTGATLRTIDTALRVADAVRHPGGAAHRRTERDDVGGGHARRARRPGRCTRTTSRAAAAVTRRTCSSSPGSTTCSASSTNPTLPVRRQRRRRAPRHDPAVPRHEPGQRQRRADRPIARPRRDDGGRGPAPRPRRHRRHLVRRPGHGTRRGDLVADLRARRSARRARSRSAADDDNERILRYLAKITINPAMVHGLAHEVGRLAVGHLADIVLWRPELFAAKPQLVIKGGLPRVGGHGRPEREHRLGRAAGARSAVRRPRRRARRTSR